MDIVKIGLEKLGDLVKTNCETINDRLQDAQLIMRQRDHAMAALTHRVDELANRCEAQQASHPTHRASPAPGERLSDHDPPRIEALVEPSTIDERLALTMPEDEKPSETASSVKCTRTKLQKPRKYSPTDLQQHAAKPTSQEEKQRTPPKSHSEPGPSTHESSTCAYTLHCPPNKYNKMT